MNKAVENISVANLITQLQYEDQVLPIAIRHPKDPKKPLQALSAGPKFPEAAQYLLQREFGADPNGFSGNDARCRLPAGKSSEFARWLERQFVLGEEAVMEWLPGKELDDRLTKPYWDGIQPPLESDDLNKLQLVELGMVRQPPPDDESERGGRGAKVRFFRNWCLIVNEKKVAHKLMTSLAITPLTANDLATTRGGRCIGWAGDQRLANNIGVGE